YRFHWDRVVLPIPPSLRPLVPPLPDESSPTSSSCLLPNREVHHPFCRFHKVHLPVGRQDRLSRTSPRSRLSASLRFSSSRRSSSTCVCWHWLESLFHPMPRVPA